MLCLDRHTKFLRNTTKTQKIPHEWDFCSGDKKTLPLLCILHILFFHCFHPVFVPLSSSVWRTRCECLLPERCSETVTFPLCLRFSQQRAAQHTMLTGVCGADRLQGEHGLHFAHRPLFLSPCHKRKRRKCLKWFQQLRCGREALVRNVIKPGREDIHYRISKAKQCGYLLSSG